MDPVTHALASFVSQTHYEHLPPEVVHETKRILLDVAGCALGSVTLDKGRLAVELARDVGGRPEATILGTRDRVAAPLAAFANGELMNALDYCALLPPNHISAFVAPAALAVAEAKRASGKRLLTALAIAHETASRVGLSLDSLRGGRDGHIAAVWGLGFDAFGAAAGAASILSLDATASADALGLAGYYAPVPSHNRFLLAPHGGGLAKYGAAGWTAQGGVTTAMLASKGYRGDRTILDEPFGFAAMTSSQSFHPHKITEQLGELWNLLRVTYKCWPCCGVFQSPLGAFTKLVADHDLAPGEFERVVISNEGHGALPRFAHASIDHHVDMQFNLPYNISLAAHRVGVGPAWQDMANLENPGIRAFMKKVTIEPYAKAQEVRHQELVVEGKPYIERRPSRVRVVARGTELVQTAEYAKWLSVENADFRASDEDLARKFRANATDAVGERKAGEAIDRIMNLEALGDVGELVEALTP